jgi:protein tyrosine/serine phosphatase
LNRVSLIEDLSGVRFQVSRKAQIRIFSTLVFLAVLGSWIYHMSVFRPARNFHEIEAGKFYRSAQLGKDEFEEIVQRYGIRTVINLRGHQPGEWWYDDEESELKRLNVRQEDIGFSTEQMQTKEDWARYAQLLKTAQRPILVHCRSGADRTGEATAVYMMDYMGKSKEEALKQLSFRYLHIPLFLRAKTLFVENYRGADWLISGYDPCAIEFRAYAKAESQCDSRPPIEAVEGKSPEPQKTPAQPDVKPASDLTPAVKQNG